MFDYIIIVRVSHDGFTVVQMFPATYSAVLARRINGSVEN